MSRTQTLDYKNTHKKREIKIYEVRQDAYVLGAEERDLYMIYTRLQEDYKVLSKTLTRNQPSLKVDRSKPCACVDRSTVIELKKNSISCFCPSLSTFSTSVKIFQIWAELQWTPSEIDTRSWRSRHTISAWELQTKSTHDLDLAERTNRFLKTNRQHTYNWFQMITPDPNDWFNPYLSLSSPLTTLSKLDLNGSKWLNQSKLSLLSPQATLSKLLYQL